MFDYLARYKAETEFNRWVEMTAPAHPARIARQAFRSVACVVSDTMREIHAEFNRSGTAYLEDVVPNSLSPEKTLQVLAPGLYPMGQMLEWYTPHYEHFKAVLGGAAGQAFSKGAGWGSMAAEIGDAFFGTLGAAIFGGTAGFLAGKSTEAQIAAEWEELQDKFGRVIECYDETMTELQSSALELIRSYRDEVAVARQRAEDDDIIDVEPSRSRFLISRKGVQP